MNNIDKIFNEINKHNKFNKSIRQCNKLITSYEYMNKFIQPIILFKEKIPKIPLLNFNKYKIQPIFNIKNQINQIFLPFNFNIDFDKSRKRFFLHEFKERKEIMSKFEQQNIFSSYNVFM